MVSGFLRIFGARPRLLLSAGFGIAVGLLWPAASLATRMLCGWDSAVALFLCLAAVMMSGANRDDMKWRADREDAGAALVLALSILAAIVSLGAITLELHNIKASGGAMAFGGVALAGVTILLSWFFVQVTFGLHYAHDYFAGPDDRKGLRFPGKGEPDYWDFLYFSFTIGAAAQTSDVSIEARRMRRFVLAHTIVAFLFNTGVLALAINIGASLFGGGS